VWQSSVQPEHRFGDTREDDVKAAFSTTITAGFALSLGAAALLLPLTAVSDDALAKNKASSEVHYKWPRFGDDVPFPPPRPLIAHSLAQIYYSGVSLTKAIQDNDVRQQFIRLYPIVIPGRAVVDLEPYIDYYGGDVFLGFFITDTEEK
jgi:hypothetical protein